MTEPLVAHIDFETRSTVDLKKSGVYRYAEDPSTEILCMSWCVGDEAVQSWAPGEPDPTPLLDHITAGGTVVAHNAGFEHAIWNAKTPNWWPRLAIEQQDCTMARAVVSALPAGLDQLGTALKLPVQKDKEGQRLMMQMCKPRRFEGDTPIWWEDAERCGRLREYCDRDVETEVKADAVLSPLTASERRVWLLDQTINDRGVAIDKASVERAIEVVAEAQKRADERMWWLTDGEVRKCGEVARIVAWLNARGIPCESVAKGEVEEIVLSSQMMGDDTAEEVIRLRRAASRASTAKYKAMLASVCRDGRVRGSLAYHAAGTGRWAGRLIQPQNLPRIDAEKELSDILRIIELLAENVGRAETCDRIELLVGPAMEWLSKCLRAMLMAGPGKKFVSGDFSNIEGRTNAWISGEAWKVQAFRDYDAGVGPDLYRLAYAKSFGVDIDAVTKADRQIGKTMELACIAEGQQVLTDTGLKAIEAITRTDLVWDGIEFVGHEGVVFRGEKKVFTYDGLTATADHLVWIEGVLRPVPFGVAAACGSRLVRAGDRGSPLRVGGGRSAREEVHTGLVDSLCGHSLHGVRAGEVDGVFDADARCQQRVPKLRGQPAACAKVAGAPVFSRQAEMHEPSVPPVQILRWPWDHFRVFLADLHGRVDRREPGCGPREGTRPRRQRQGLRAGEPSMVDPCGEHQKLSNVRTAKTYDIRNAGPRNRFTASGRLVHNCGFQGGVGAFQTMGSNMGVNVGDERAKELVTAWRDAHPKIVQSWWDLQNAAIEAVSAPGVVVSCLNDKIRYVAANGFLYCKLPSSRILSYAAPKLVWKETPFGSPRIQIEYMGVDSLTKRWQAQSLYGGVQSNNVVQGTARDLMVEAMFRVEEAGYPLVLTVHDELLSEVQERFGSADEYQSLMSQLPAWAEGLPVATAAWEDKRYVK